MTGRSLWLVGVLAGCASTTSAAGRFVTDVALEGNTLVVERCRLGVEVVDRDALRLLLFPLLPFGADGGGLFTQRTPVISSCRATRSSLVAGGAR